MSIKYGLRSNGIYKGKKSKERKKIRNLHGGVPDLSLAGGTPAEIEFEHREGGISPVIPYPEIGIAHFISLSLFRPFYLL